jgi:peptidoglycan/xylan/chitin deacetylase (PgdA/CDA1 family)
MQTPYPDLRHFTVRDYGNRIGVFRILGALTAANVKTTFAVNGEIAKRYPPLVKAIQGAGHQIAAHGLSTDHIHHDGLKVAEETKLIKDTLMCFDEPPTAWLSPARTQSSRTLELLAKAGIKQCFDWEMDQVPVRMETKNGPITDIPLSNELSDFTLLHTRRQTEESWLKQITDAVDYLIDEYDEYGAQTLVLRLTPYIIGQPFRIWALRALLGQLSANPDVLLCSANEMLDAIINGDFT